MADPLDSTVRSDPATTESDGDEAYCAACNQSFGLDHMFCPNDGARLVKLKARPDLLLGRVFDARYEIRAVLGHGGMGTVYRGWQLSVDREIAIKVIHPKLASVRAVAKRFLREARLSSRLNQPNIVNVYDFGQTDDGILYLVMELLRGQPLSRDLEARRPLALRRIAAITAQICDALDAAHGQGIVHRDLKPQNIVILDDPPGRDFVKILDFGLAKSLLHDTTSLVTQSDALLGTPLYMPPEQILGKSSDQRADLYSLGCILYQLVSGRPPFVGDNINVVLGAHIREPAAPLPDGVPPRLADLIQRLMMKAPEDRPATAGVVHDLMAAIASGASAALPELPAPEHAAPPQPPPDHARPANTAAATGGQARASWQQRASMIVAGVAAIVAAIAVVLAMSSRSAQPGHREVGSAGSGAPGDHGGATAVERLDARPAHAAAPVDAGLDEQAAAPPDAPRREASRPPGGARPSGASQPGGDHRGGGAALHPRLPTDAPPHPPIDARPASPPDAGLPDLELLPTRPGH